MPKFIDLTGKKFGRLLVLKRVENDKWNHTQYLCLCNCGNEKIIKGGCLKSGVIVSCGCFHNEITKKLFTIHGHNRKNKRSRTYSSWNSMIQRCTNAKCKEYKNYGGRKIKICKRWLKFENFLEDVGERPKGLTLDRIDNNDDYKPNNWKWSNKKEQNRNKRNSNILLFKNKNQYLVDLAKEYKINPGALWNRIYILGWSIDKALITPVKKLRKRKLDESSKNNS
jgi:hypothetical protein